MWPAVARAARMLRTRRVSVGRGDPAGEWAARLIGADRYVPGASVSLEDAGFYDVGGALVAWSVGELVEASKSTPMVRVRVPGCRARVWAKLEWFNPFSCSMKDRAVASLIRGASRHRIYEVSSGNTALALASLASARGLRAALYLARHAPMAAEEAIRLLGQRVERLPHPITVEARVDPGPGWERLGQFESPLNPAAHMRGTGREIIVQARHAGFRPSVFVAPAGTSGTVAGAGFMLHHYYRGNVRVYAVAPPRGDVVEGIRWQEWPSGWARLLLPPGTPLLHVSRREAVLMLRVFARLNGLLPGPSGAATLAAVRGLCRAGIVGAGDDVVVILPDHGLKYPGFLSEALGKVNRIP